MFGKSPESQLTVRDAMSWSVMIAVAIGLLVAGREFLIPLAVAILVWSLLDSFRHYLQRFSLRGHHLPRWFATTVAVLVMLCATYVVYEILIRQATALQNAAPEYQANFARLTGKLAGRFGLQQTLVTDNLLERFDLGTVFAWLGGIVGGLIVNLVLVGIYVGFLMFEQGKWAGKFARLQPDAKRAMQARQMFEDVSKKVQRYMWVKTVVSLLTALVCYAILKFVGLDFAATWALVIFFLNYIPNIGSVIAVIFPSLLAIVQFESIAPFVLVVSGLGSAQFVIGNIIEPIFQGRSLNLSSFMILVSLMFWGSVWGVPGMILSVPIMVTIAIVCSHVAPLNWIAVFLSADGRLMGAQDEVK